jgi:hypothetical protein
MNLVKDNILVKLFINRKFLLHRLIGLSYLIQYAFAVYLYFSNYEYFLNSILIWSLPLTGVLQSINASLTFTFLPKQQADPGYYSDKSSMSYNFICENIFFSMLLCFQWLYMSDYFYSWIKYLFVPEIIFVFFPYILRTLFPKTRFRDSLFSEKNKSDANHYFFYIGTYITKIFYIWAKHYIGFFLNYVRFMNNIDEQIQKELYLLLISSAFATTISLFLHTLKFKKYMGPKTSFSIYVISYLSTFYSFYGIINIFTDNIYLTSLTLVGLVLNFGPWYIQWLWQLIMCVYLFSFRYGFII